MSVLSKEFLHLDMIDEVLKFNKSLLMMFDKDVYYPSIIKTNMSLLEELRQYRDLEEQGLLLRLPCKVGDTVYRIEKGQIKQTKITRYDIYADDSMWFCFSESLGLPISKFKTEIFLTQSEAEGKLREMEGK